MKKKVVVVRVWEGLGNQLFQYAYARSLQEKGKYRVYLECRRVYKEYLSREDLSVERKCQLQHFNVSLKAVDFERYFDWDFMKQNTLVKKVKFWLAFHKIGAKHYVSDFTKKADHFQYHPELYSFTAPTYVMGHFLNKQYFNDIRPILLRELRLKIPPRISKSLERLLISENTVSVHIRRTDFIKRGYCISSDQYYIDAIEYMRMHVENPKFLFFSDDIVWVKKRFESGNREEYYFVSDGILKDYEELAIMYQCRHNIIANSTFSFWGAWLNDNPEKIVVAPKSYAPTFIPDEWIRV